MIIDTEKLICACSVSISKNLIELELEERVPEVVTAHGEIVFVCRSGGNILICSGRVEKYEEIPVTVESGNVFSRLNIRGRSIDFSL